MYNNSVRTTNKTQHFTITKIECLTLSKEMINVYGENHKKHIYRKRWVIVEAGGTSFSKGLMHDRSGLQNLNWKKDKHFFVDLNKFAIIIKGEILTVFWHEHNLINLMTESVRLWSHLIITAMLFSLEMYEMCNRRNKSRVAKDNMNGQEAHETWKKERPISKSFKNT
jgi:hypothetical protein